MQIQIANRYRPFSHKPGTSCLLPGSTLRFQIFPAKVIVSDLTRSPVKIVEELTLPIKGPVQDFTVQLDLEMGAILVWGKSQAGYFRYRIHADQSQKGYALIVEKGSWLEVFATKPIKPYKVPKTERLSLGIHKAQDWDHVSKRADLAEIFPFWLRLGRLTPYSKMEKVQGALALLQSNSLDQLFLAGFEGILSPRLIDTDFQGILPHEKNLTQSPLFLLTEGAKLIQNLFAVREGNKIILLPQCPFQAGRLTDFCLDDVLVSFEWRKCMLRRMEIRADKDSEWQLTFPKKVKRFRMRTKRLDRGKFFSADLPLAIQEGMTYFLDRFE